MLASGLKAAAVTSPNVARTAAGCVCRSRTRRRVADAHAGRTPAALAAAGARGPRTTRRVWGVVGLRAADWMARPRSSGASGPSAGIGTGTTRPSAAPCAAPGRASAACPCRVFRAAAARLASQSASMTRPAEHKKSTTRGSNERPFAAAAALAAAPAAVLVAAPRSSGAWTPTPALVIASVCVAMPRVSSGACAEACRHAPRRTLSWSCSSAVAGAMAKSST